MYLEPVIYARRTALPLLNNYTEVDRSAAEKKWLDPGNGEHVVVPAGGEASISLVDAHAGSITPTELLIQGCNDRTMEPMDAQSLLMLCEGTVTVKDSWELYEDDERQLGTTRDDEGRRGVRARSLPRRGRLLVGL